MKIAKALVKLAKALLMLAEALLKLAKIYLQEAKACLRIKDVRLILAENHFKVAEAISCQDHLKYFIQIKKALTANIAKAQIHQKSFGRGVSSSS